MVACASGHGDRKTFKFFKSQSPKLCVPADGRRTNRSRETRRTRSKEDRVVEETDWNRDEKSRGKEMLAERIIEIQSPLSCYSLASFPPCRRRKLWKSLPLLLLEDATLSRRIRFFFREERKRRRKRKRKYSELKKTVHSLEGLIEAGQMTTTMPPRRVRPVE